MKAFCALAALLPVLAAPLTPLAPAKRQSMGANITDTDVLQYALTLENLEAAFYAGALEQFSWSDFSNAGYPDWVRGRVAQISQHEATHAALLATALGSAAVQPCNYSFPYTDVTSFLGLADAIENIGVSAYIGAAGFITTPAYLQIAGTILTVEARHNSWFNSAVEKGAPWTGPFDTPLGLDMVYTLASQLITSCPQSNAMLPVQAYPALTVGGLPIFAGTGNQTITFDTIGSANGTSSTLYAAFYNGLGMQLVQMNGMTAEVPGDIQGFSYVLVTSASNATDVSTSNIVAGPAEMITPFDAYTSNPGFENPFMVEEPYNA